MPQGAIPPEVQVSNPGVRTLEFSNVCKTQGGTGPLGVTLFGFLVLRRVLFLPLPPCWRRKHTFQVCGVFFSVFALVLRAVRLDRRFPVLGASFAPGRFVVFLISTGLAAQNTCSTLCF